MLTLQMSPDSTGYYYCTLAERSTVEPHDGFADVASRHVPKSPCVSEPSRRRPELHLVQQSLPRPQQSTAQSTSAHLKIALPDYLSQSANPSIWLNHSTASLQSHSQLTGSTPVLASNFVAQRGVPLTLPQALDLFSDWSLVAFH